MKKSLVTIIIISSCLISQDVNKVGTTAANFLKIGPGSRAIGMGGAFVSVADDASAMYWNPGGVSQLSQSELLVNHTKWFADIGFTYVGFLSPIPRVGTVGISVTALTMDPMEVTRYGQENGSGETFKAGSYAIAFLYAKQLTDRFGIGGNVKYVKEYISQSSSGGFALDIGTLFVTPFSGIRFGASISNFGEKLNITGKDLLVTKDVSPINGNNESINAYLSTDYFDLPLLLRVGLSGELIDNSLTRLTWSVDGIHPNDNSEYMNLGMELALFNELVSIRAGMKSLYMSDSDEEFTLGGGLFVPVNRTMKLQADYAFESWVHLNSIHKLTLRLLF